MTQEKIRDEGNANEESALGASSAATSSHVKTERYIRDVPGGYEKVTVERFKGERPASPAARRSDVDENARLVVEYPPDRECENCHGVELGLVDYGGGYWRKECLRCGSTGPFAPITKAGAK